MKNGLFPISIASRLLLQLNAPFPIYFNLLGNEIERKRAELIDQSPKHSRESGRFIVWAICVRSNALDSMTFIDADNVSLVILHW